MIFSNEIKEWFYKESDIKRLLGGKNILSQEIVDKYEKKFNGLVGRTDLHDERGNLIYFTDVDRILRDFNPEAVAYNFMLEIENLLRRVVYE